MDYKFGSGERKSDAWWRWHIFLWNMEDLGFAIVAILLIPVYIIYMCSLLIYKGAKWLITKVKAN